MHLFRGSLLAELALLYVADDFVVKLRILVFLTFSGGLSRDQLKEIHRPLSVKRHALYILVGCHVCHALRFGPFRVNISHVFCLFLAQNCQREACNYISVHVHIRLKRGDRAFNAPTL